MIIGTVVGVAQTNEADAGVASIAHGGYLLPRRSPATTTARARLVHLLTYTVTVSAFGIIGLSRIPNGRTTDGLRRPLADHPALAALMTIFCCRWAGFADGRLHREVRVQRRHQGGLRGSIIGVLTSVVSVFFYLHRRHDV
jgi:NADH:ubiquinone oxidoreductase subunit 2 (subunit N)